MNVSKLFNLELDVCVYLMSSTAVEMEIEEGANATVSDIITRYIIRCTVIELEAG